MTPKQAEKKYGKRMLEKMHATGLLSGITATITKKGELDVPKRDYDIAYRKAIGRKIRNEEID